MSQQQEVKPDVAGAGEGGDEGGGGGEEYLTLKVVAQVRVSFLFPRSPCVCLRDCVRAWVCLRALSWGQKKRGSAHAKRRKESNDETNDLSAPSFFFSFLLSRPLSPLSLFTKTTTTNHSSEQDGAQVSFKTKKSTQLKKLMKAYCERMNSE